jgi:hypothetical protein
LSGYAETTSVSVEKTRAELETTLGRFGADAFGYMTEAGRACVQFRARGKYVRFVLPLPKPDERRLTHYLSRAVLKARTAEAAMKEWEQGCRSAWRALFLAVKAKLVAVDAKITSFEQEFLAHIVLPDGSTAGDAMLPQIEEAYATGRMPSFTLALPAPKESGVAS